MIRCPFCKASNVDNSIFCAECGHYLLSDVGIETDHLADNKKNLDMVAQSQAELDSDPQSVLRVRFVLLTIGDQKRTLKIPLGETVLIGRVDAAADTFPGVDLSEEKEGKSVSRRHAKISTREDFIVVEDIGSTNGTFLNGKRLDPYIAEIIRDGDNLLFGKVETKVEIIQHS